MVRHLLVPPEGPFVIDGLSTPPGEPTQAAPPAAPPVQAAPQAAPLIQLSIVVPTYNEAKNIHELLRQLHVVLEAQLAGSYEIIVVDDDSPDRTWELAGALAAEIPGLKVMRRTTERGLSTAVIRGWQVARGEWLGVLDADLQHPPEVVGDLVNQVKRGADIAIASRHVEGGGVSTWSLSRRVLSRAAQMLGLLMLPDVASRVSDPMSGYFVMRRTAIQGALLSPLGYKILLEVLGRGRMRWISEVPYVFQEREMGDSKVTRGVYIDYVRHLIRLRSADGPLKRFARFALVGLSGVAVDMGLLFVLSDPSMLSWGLTRSKLIAAEFAIANNFMWNDLWTFRDLTLHQRTLWQRLLRFGKFQSICMLGVLINVVLLNIQFNWLGVNRYVANAVAIAVVTGWNFWLNLKLSWRPKPA